ncbi:MAG: hypothetical protein ACYDHZ_02620 [Dehalococcoidia bacterium]
MELEHLELSERKQEILLELFAYSQDHPDSEGMDIDILGRRIMGILHKAIRSDVIGLELDHLVSWSKKPRGNNKVILTRLGESYLNKYLDKKGTRKSNRIVDSIELKPNFHGIGIDLKRLFRKE